MTKSKSFTGYQKTDDIEFDVNGTTFRCIPMLPGVTLLEFTSTLDEGNPSAMASSVIKLLDTAIVAEQHEEWHAFASDPANGVTMDLLGEIAGYLVEEYVGRPLPQSEGSSDGPVPIGPLRPAQPSSAE